MRKWSFPNRATRGAGERPLTGFRLLAYAALLAQLQIVWLAGFHYHPELAGAPESRPTAWAVPNHSTSPADDSRSCAFCQIVRHGVSTPATAWALPFNIISTVGLAPVEIVRPPIHSQVRLAGRDPPHSFLANC